ncbi:MAG: wzd [Deferribacteraceae bacterium]|nr:wzd [Deferribacteraceae bacterium]
MGGSKIGKYQSFKELNVWKESEELAVKIYKITNEIVVKDFGLFSQMRRSAVSIPSNIAEGYDRNSTKEFIRFLYIAKGSLNELTTQVDIAYDIGYIDGSNCQMLNDKMNKIGAMLTNLIKSRRGK